MADLSFTVSFTFGVSPHGVLLVVYFSFTFGISPHGGLVIYCFIYFWCKSAWRPPCRLLFICFRRKSTRRPCHLLFHLFWCKSAWHPPCHYFRYKSDKHGILVIYFPVISRPDRLIFGHLFLVYLQCLPYHSLVELSGTPPILYLFCFPIPVQDRFPQVRCLHLCLEFLHSCSHSLRNSDKEGQTVDTYFLVLFQGALMIYLRAFLKRFRPIDFWTQKEFSYGFRFSCVFYLIFEIVCCKCL